MVRATGWVLAIALVLAGGWALAAKFNKVVSIGDKAPAFSKLVGVDGKEYSLADMKDSKVVVVCFTCNRCPVAIDYEDKFIKFASDYKAKGVTFIAIDANGDSAEDMKERADKKGFTFPYVADADQSVARAYGATCTPHLFVLGPDRTIAYMGAFDEGDKPVLADAVDALLAGKSVSVTETKQVGCGIPYKKKAQ